MIELYNVRSVGDGYRVVKFDKWFSVLAIYELKQWRGNLGCACFQARAPNCRHRDMIALFEQHERVNTGWFYEYDASKWHAPITLRPRRQRNDRQVLHAVR